ncbi:MAG: ribonuclease P protein component, partial [Chloroflexota bacterium]
MVAKCQRLTKGAAYQALNRQGRSWANRLLVLKALPSSLPVNRYGFSVSKAVGKAACRNRVKRRLRENIRRTHLKQGWDILIIARP